MANFTDRKSKCQDFDPLTREFSSRLLRPGPSALRSNQGTCLRILLDPNASTHCTGVDDIP